MGEVAASADLTLLNNTLVAVIYTLNAILVIVGLGWQQSENLVVAAKRRRGPAVGRKANSLSDGEFMSFHSSLPHSVNVRRLRPAWRSWPVFGPAPRLSACCAWRRYAPSIRP